MFMGGASPLIYLTMTWVSEVRHLYHMNIYVVCLVLSGGILFFGMNRVFELFFNLRK